MMWKTCRRGVFRGLAVAASWLLLAGGGVAAESGPAPLPKFSQVEKTVREYFKKLPRYRSGEILSRGQVEPVFRALEGIGWRVAGRKAILEAVLPDNDRLVRRLRTPAGKKFARQVAAVPEGYDRLYRLSLLPDGLQKIGVLIKGPDGYLMIKYMTTTAGGKALGRMLSDDPGGKGFNKPTQRIYTEDMLLDCLKREYGKATGAPVEPEEGADRQEGVSAVQRPSAR